MAALNPPISTITVGGYNATITDLFKRRNTDQLEGHVETPAYGQKAVHWDFHGVCRDNHPDLNLDMCRPELAFLQKPKK